MGNGEQVEEGNMKRGSEKVKKIKEGEGRIQERKGKMKDTERMYDVTSICIRPGFLY